MHIEDNTILIAPGALHLPLYEEIYKQKGSCMNITVLSLEAYLNRHLQKPKPSTASVLYEYERALSDLPSTNTFYSSRKDYDFLRDCHRFMTNIQLYDITEFPTDTSRERDLLEIIQKLSAIDLWVKEAKSLPFEDAKRVRILTTQRDPLSEYWVQLLFSKGAKPLGKEHHRRFYYWATSNPHKEMEVCADAIVHNRLPAQSVLVALSNPDEKYALAQAFESRKIPFTFYSQDNNSPVLDKWKAALEYVAHPSAGQLMNLLKAMFPATGYDLRRYLELYPEGESDLQNISYEENSILGASQFAALQTLEVQCTPWKEKLLEIQNWDIYSFEDIGQLIMDQIPSPTEDDIRIFQGVLDSWTQIQSFIQKREDLNLFIRSLDTLHPSATLSELKGVLVAERDQISCLHEHVFCIGMDAKSFPGSSQDPGIFGEDYLAKLNYPSLETRMTNKLNQSKQALMCPKEVYFLYAQSDYEGKSVESSHELNTWLEVFPKFKAAAQTSMNLKPSFSMESLKSQVFFEGEDQTLHTKSRQLSSYADCPLKNLLHYGLHLKKPIVAQDVLVLQPTIVSTIMRQSLSSYGKPFYELDFFEIEALVQHDFSFARRVVPSKAKDIEALARLCSEELFWLFQNLKPICTEMGLTIVEGDFQIDLEEKIEGLPMRIAGTLTSGLRSHAIFNVYSKQDEEGFALLEQPLGTLDFSLYPKASSHPAFTLSYGRGAAQANAFPVEARQASAKGTESFLKDSFVAQNFEKPRPGLMESLAKSVPTYEKKQEKILNEAHAYAKGIVKNDFYPLHKPSACVRCAYRAICRNAAMEKGD